MNLFGYNSLKKNLEVYIQLTMSKIWASAYSNLLKFEACVTCTLQMIFTPSVPWSEVSSACQALS